MSLKQAPPFTQDVDISLGQKQKEDLGVQDCIKMLDLW